MPESRAAARLAQIPAEALDAPAGFLEVFGPGRIRNAERRTDTEGRALHHRDAFAVQQLGDEVLVGRELFSIRRSAAHGAGAGRIDIKRALGARAFDALGL